MEHAMDFFFPLDHITWSQWYDEEPYMPPLAGVASPEQASG